MKTILKKYLYMPLILNILVVLWLVYVTITEGGDTDFFGAFLIIIIMSLLVYDFYVVLFYYLFKTIIHFWQEKIEQFRIVVYILFIVGLIVPFYGLYLFIS